MAANTRKLVLTTGFTGHHLEPGHPDNPKQYRICGCKTRQEEALYTYCTRPAGWGTYHAGSGRCKLHGGAGPVGPRKSGRYSDLFIGRMAEALDHIAGAEEEPLDLLPELMLQRGILVLLVNSLETGQPIPKTNPLDMARLVQSARETSSAGCVARSESVGRETIPDTVGDGGIAQIMGIEGTGVDPLTENFTDSKSEISSLDLYNAIRLQLDTIVNTVSKIIASKNQTALTTAEVTYILATMKEAIGKYVEPGKQGEFVNFLRVRLGEKMGSKAVEIEDGEE